MQFNFAIDILSLQKNATVCTRLECEYPGFKGFCKAASPAAEGSPCGNGLVSGYFVLLYTHWNCWKMLLPTKQLIIIWFILLVLLEWQMCAGRNNNQRAREKEITQRLYPEIKSSSNQENFVVGLDTKSARHLLTKEIVVNVVSIN